MKQSSDWADYIHFLGSSKTIIPEVIQQMLHCRTSHLLGDEKLQRLRKLQGHSLLKFSTAAVHNLCKTTLTSQDIDEF